MDGLAAGHEACVLVTQIEIGTCRQRALLFKLMFDHLAEMKEPLLEVRSNAFHPFISPLACVALRLVSSGPQAAAQHSRG